MDQWTNIQRYAWKKTVLSYELWLTKKRRLPFPSEWCHGRILRDRQSQAEIPQPRLCPFHLQRSQRH
jgi:hypothetical protein